MQKLLVPLGGGSLPERRARSGQRVHLTDMCFAISKGLIFGKTRHFHGQAAFSSTPRAALHNACTPGLFPNTGEATSPNAEDRFWKVTLPPSKWGGSTGWKDMQLLELPFWGTNVSIFQDNS